MNIRYRAELSEVESAQLVAMLSGGKHAARKLKRAQILLAADARISDEAIASSISVGGSTVTEPNRASWRPPRRRHTACFSAWGFIAHRSTRAGSTWWKSKSVCCAVSIWIAESVSVTFLVSEIDAWQQQRNASGARAKWKFTTQRAPTKLARAYPDTVEES